MCRELVCLLSVIDFKSMLKLVYRVAPENFLKENHILLLMFSSGPRNKLFKRVDMDPIQLAVHADIGEVTTASVERSLLFHVLTLTLT